MTLTDIDKSRRIETAVLDGVDMLFTPEQKEQRAEFDLMSPDRGAASRQRIANTMFLSGETGRPASEVGENYDYWKALYARQNFDGVNVDDDASFTGKVKETMTKRREERHLIQGPEGQDEASGLARESSLAGLIGNAAMRGEDYLPAWSAWQKTATGKPGFDPAKLGRYEESARAIHSELAQRAAAVRPTVEKIFAGLTGERDGSAGAYGGKDLIDEMMTLPPGQRQLAQAMLAQQAATEGENKKRGGQFWQAFGRGSAGLVVGTARTWEMDTLDDAEQKLNAMKPGDEIGGRFPDLFSAAMGRSASGLETQALKFLAEPLLTNKVVTREMLDEARAKVALERERVTVGAQLEQIGKGALDPIKGGGFMTEKVWYPFAESILPQIALAAATRRIAPVGTGFTGALASSAGAMIPMHGIMADQNAQQLMQQNTGMDAGTAYRLGRNAAYLQTGLEYAELMLGMGAAPKLGQALLTMKAAAWKTAGKALGVGLVGQSALEGVQDILPPVVQALSKDAPGVNWDRVMYGGLRADGTRQGGYWAQRVDTALAILPMVVFGTGGKVMQAKASAAQLQQVASTMTDTLLHAAGLAPEVRATILAESDAVARLDAFSTALPAADAATAAEGTARMKAEQKAEQKAMESNMAREGITFEKSQRDGADIYRVTKGDTSTEHADPGSAYAAIIDHMGAADAKASNPALEMLDAMTARRTAPTEGAEVTLNEDVKSVTAWLADRTVISEDSSLTEAQRDRALREIDAMQNRMDIYEKANPDKDTRWHEIAVDGQSGIERTKEGVYKAVIKLSNGADVETVFEEFVESDLAAFLATGQATEGRMLSALEEAERLTGDAYLLGHTGGQDAAKDTLALKEAYSKLAHVFVRGQSRAGQQEITDVAFVAKQARKADARSLRTRLVAAMNAGQLDAELVATLKRAAEWMKATASRAIRLNRARRAAGGTLAIDEFLNKSIGLEADAQHAAGVVAEAARIIRAESKPTDNESQIVNKEGPGFSLKPIPVIVAKSGATFSKNDAIEKVLAEFDNGKKLLKLSDGREARISRNVLNKMTSHMGPGGSAKEFVRERILAIQSLPDLASNAVELPTHQDNRRDPEVVSSHEYFAPFRVGDDVYRARLFLKVFVENSGKGNKLHSLRLENIEVEEVPAHLASSSGVSPDLQQVDGVESRDATASPSTGDTMTISDLMRGRKSINGTSFRLSPMATLDRLAADIERQKRDPEARRKIYDSMKAALNTLRTRWSETQQRWNGESPPVVEQKSKKELDKEQAFREAMAYEAAEESIYDTLTPSAQAALGMTGEDTSAYGGVLAQRFSGGRSGTAGRIMGRSAALRESTDGSVRIKGEYDGAAGLPSMFFGGILTPDLAAQEAYDAGEISAPTPDALWEAMRSELQTQASNKGAMAAAMVGLKEAQKQARNKAKEEAADWRTNQDEMQAKDWDARAVMLRHLRTLDALLSALPPEVRAKVGGWVAVAQLKTQAAMQKELENRLAVADMHLEKSLKEDALASIAKLIDKAKPKREAGKKPKGKLGAAVHRFFDEVERVMNLTPDEARQETILLEAGYLKEGIEDTEAAAIYEKQQILDTYGALAGKDAAHVTRALDLLEQVYVEGRNRWRMIEEARLADVKEKQGVVQAALGGISYSAIARNKDRALNALGLLKNGSVSLKSFAEVLETLLGRDHVLAVQFARAAREGMAQRTDEVMAAASRWRAATEKATGKRGVKAQRIIWDMGTVRSLTLNRQPLRMESIRVPIDALSDPDALKALGLNAAEIADLNDQFETLPPDSQQEFLTTKRQIKGDAEAVPATEAEAVYLSMLWAQDAYQASLTAAGFGAETQAEIEEGLSPAAKQLRTWLTNEYRDNYEPLARQFRNMFGVDLPGIKNYAPGRFYNSGTNDKVMDVTGSGVVEGGFRAGFLGDRKAHTAAPRAENAFNVFFGHVNQTAHWKALAPLARELRGVFGNADVKQAIESAYGADMGAAVQKWIGAIEGNGIQAAHSKILEAVMSAQAYGALAWKMGTLVKQSTALLGAAYRMPPGAYLRGLGKLATGQLEYGKMWESGLIQRRLEGGWSPEVRAAMARAFGGKPSRRASFMQQGMELIGFVDAAFTTGSAAIAYDYHFREARKAGMGEAEAATVAMDEAANVVSRTAQPVEITNRSLFELEAGSVAKTIFMFSSEARQKSSMLLTAWGNTLTGKPTAEDFRVLVISHLIVAPMIQAVGAAWRDSRDDDDDELFDDKYWNPWDFARAAALGPFAGVPILRDLVDDYNGETGVLAAAGKTVIAGIALTGGAPENEKEKAEWYEKKIVTVLNGLGGFPAVAANIGDQVFRVADNLVDSPAEVEAKKKRAAAKAKKAD
jgi:Large polyvalent protein-associated domain 3